ncbi:MAG: hypothetical protein WC498_03415 [Candidatus Saccharimonadales bacterium]
MKRFIALLVLFILVAAMPWGIVRAAGTPPTTKGLLITPLRKYTAVDAGSAQTSSFTVSNLTDRPLTVTLSIKQFSVANYTYDYRFSDPNNNWVTLGLKQVSLAPNRSQKIPYTISVPVGSAPGGHYYTLFASADMATSGFKSTVQAATLLYLTVNGRFIQTGKLQSGSIQRLAFGNQIAYTLDALNTGNVHYFVYLSGSFHGWLTKPPTPLTAHILLPGTVRHMRGFIPAPVLPGVYRATFGYKTDSGQTFTTSRYVVFVPPWFIAFILAAVMLGVALRSRKQSASTKNTTH